MMDTKLFFLGRLAGCVVVALVLAWLPGGRAAPTAAATNTLITVNSTAEVINSTDGKCTLREAIISANTDTASGAVPGECPAGSGADTLELGVSATYTLSVADNTDPTLGPNGLPVIVSDITVHGNSATIERSAVDGTPEFRLAQVAASGVLDLQAVTLGGGDSTANGSGIYNAGSLTLTDCTMTKNRYAYDTGGAIYSTGTVAVDGCTFSQNGADFAYPTVYGGAIANEGGMLTVTGSAFTNNTALYGGGAIWSTGTLDISTSSFDSNSTHQNQSAGGGAVSIAGTGTIADSTFTGNAALVYGGALFSQGTVSVARSTFTGNSVSGSHGTGGGGAIFGDVDVTNSTFYKNNAVTFYAMGSAIVGSGTVINSTFADNPDSTSSYHPAALIGVTLKNSVLYNTSCLNVTDGGGNVGSLASNAACAGKLGDALLGALQNNGGLTETMLPASNSPVRGAALNASCPATDQRGITRPQSAYCDSGSVELDGLTPPTLLRPGNGKHVQTSTPTLKWKAGETDATYKLQVRMGSATGEQVMKATTTATQRTTKPLAAGHWYFWRVTSTSTAGTASTGWFKFYVE